MLGAIAGDIVGSLYEFTRQKRYDFEMLPEGSGFTDDSVMTVAVAHWLSHCDEEGNTDHSKEHLIRCMQTLGREYPCAGIQLLAMECKSATLQQLGQRSGNAGQPGRSLCRDSCRSS